MLKIALVIPTLGRGGAERLVTQLANALSSGNEVHLFVLFRTKDIIEHVNNPLVKITFLGELRNKAQVYFRLNRALIKFKPNVLHTHLSAVAYVIPASIWLRINIGAKCFHTLHNIATHDSPGVLRLIYRVVFRSKAFEPIAISNVVRESVEKLFNAKNVVVIKNGVQKPGLSDRVGDVLRSIDNFKRKTGARKVLLCLARIHQQKNIKLLLSLARGNSEVAIVLAGEKSSSDLAYYEEVMSELSKLDNVLYLGAIDNVGDYIYSSDALILTSSFEGLPMAIIESMSMGKNIISTSVGGVPEVVGGFGYLSRDVDYFSLMEQVNAYMNAPQSENNRRADIATQVYRDLYSIDICAINHLKVYRG